MQILESVARATFGTVFPGSTPSWLDTSPAPNSIIDELNVLESLPADIAEKVKSAEHLAIASNYSVYFIQADGLLLSIGAGVAGFPRGKLLAKEAGETTGAVWLGFVSGVLYRRFASDTPGLLSAINTSTLKVDGVVSQGESDSLIGDLPFAMFAYDDVIGIIECTAQSEEQGIN